MFLQYHIHKAMSKRKDPKWVSHNDCKLTWTKITKSAKNELEMHALSLNIQQISWQQYLWYIFITKHAVSSHRTATVIKLQLTLNDSEVKWRHLGFNYLSVWLFFNKFIVLHCHKPTASLTYGDWQKASLMKFSHPHE